jgi:hypothetical protein
LQKEQEIEVNILENTNTEIQKAFATKGMAFI